MNFTNINYEVVENVARISLNRPRYRNAQSTRLLEELDQAFSAAAGDPGIRVIVLRGEGGIFSAGHDLGTPEQLADRATRPYGDEAKVGRLGHIRMESEETEMFLRWRDLPKPTIAAVAGYAIFNGWLLASTMDLIVAAEDAVFLPPMTTSYWDLGDRKARDLKFRLRPLAAREALSMGLATRVVPATELDEAAMELAREIAQVDPLRLWKAKLTLNLMEDMRGYSKFARASFGYYAAGFLDRRREDGGTRARVGGRIRMQEVQQAFERAGRVEALPKSSPQE